MAKRKYYSDFKIKLMKLYFEDHWSYPDLRNKYYVSMLSLQDWHNLVEFWGYSALRAQSQRRFSVKFRLKVVKYYLNHHEGFSKVAGRFCLTHTHVQTWVRKYNARGINGLKPRYKPGKRDYGINRHDKLAKYKAENVRLKAKNKGLELDKIILKTLARIKHRTSKRPER